MTGPGLAGLDEALVWRREAAGTVVFTNGVFDLIHVGHVEYLKEARSQGDWLIVGVNSDRSARALGKGTGRPVNPSADRAHVVASLGSVDCVVVFDEDTPFELIEILRPDVVVKGGDYTLATMPGADIVMAWGGRAEVLPFMRGYSTTSLIGRIRGES